MSNAIAVLQEDIYAVRETFNAVVADRTIDFDREAGFAMQLLRNNDYLAKVAMSARQSLVDAITNVAAIGISLNPAKKQAYLVPRDGRVCLDISYMGLIDMAVDAGTIMWAQSEVVYATDRFVLRGVDQTPVHEYSPFAKDRGEVVGVYVTVKTKQGDYLTETMSVDEVNSIRDRSSGWKSGKNTPWKTDYNEMARKTVVKRACKYWPRGMGEDRLSKAIDHLNTDGAEGLHELQPKSHLPQEPEGYEAFEQEWLPVLQAAAENGTAAYSEAIQSVPRGALRDQLGMKHHRTLSQRAKAAAATDAEVTQ